MDPGVSAHLGMIPATLSTWGGDSSGCRSPSSAGKRLLDDLPCSRKVADQSPGNLSRGQPCRPWLGVP